jgi:hypothetical protein
MARTTTARSAPIAGLLLGLLTLSLLAAACGGGAAASPSPSPSASASSMTQRLEALKTYVAQVTPIYNAAATAVGSLDGAVSGLSKKPDKTWAESATQMETASAALGTAATDLGALTPPASLQGAQDSAVKALKAAQNVIDTTGSYLSKRVYDPTYPDIKTQIKRQVTEALAAAWASILNAVGQ